MAERVREIVSWLGVLGIPTIFGMASWCIRECLKFSESINILHAAQKAQMRSQLLEQYYVIKERGFVWDTELAEWINQYTAYHKLVGDNAVLDSRKDELLKFDSKVR